MVSVGHHALRHGQESSPSESSSLRTLTVEVADAGHGDAAIAPAPGPSGGWRLRTVDELPDGRRAQRGQHTGVVPRAYRGRMCQGDRLPRERSGPPSSSFASAHVSQRRRKAVPDDCFGETESSVQ